MREGGGRGCSLKCKHYCRKNVLILADCLLLSATQNQPRRDRLNDQCRGAGETLLNGLDVDNQGARL